MQEWHIFTRDESNEVIKIHPPTLHDLFNELHRCLMEEPSNPIDHNLHGIAQTIDTLHHDYTDLVDEPITYIDRMVEAQHENPSDRQPPSNVVNRGSW